MSKGSGDRTADYDKYDKNRAIIKRETPSTAKKEDLGAGKTRYTYGS